MSFETEINVETDDFHPSWYVEAEADVVVHHEYESPSRHSPGYQVHEFEGIDAIRLKKVSYQGGLLGWVVGRRGAGKWLPKWVHRWIDGRAYVVAESYILSHSEDIAMNAEPPDPDYSDHSYEYFRDSRDEHDSSL